MPTAWLFCKEKRKDKKVSFTRRVRQQLKPSFVLFPPWLIEFLFPKMNCSTTAPCGHKAHLSQARKWAGKDHERRTRLTPVIMCAEEQRPQIWVDRHWEPKTAIDYYRFRVCTRLTSSLIFLEHGRCSGCLKLILYHSKCPLPVLQSKRAFYGLKFLF